jgi:O-acetylhomoserine/O-acetylserine sulfhydrylase-like pyridoxal-dependent enzyme
VDLEGIAAVARRHRVPLVVDNTLATPCLIRPIEHGADIVVHSASKFLGGHGQTIAGVIVDGGTFPWREAGGYNLINEPWSDYDDIVVSEAYPETAFATACRVFGLRDLGPGLSPMNAFLVLTGIETLPLRMELAEGAGLDLHLRAQGRPGGGAALHLEPEARVAPDEYRRGEVARDSPRDDDAPAADGSREARRLRRA